MPDIQLFIDDVKDYRESLSIVRPTCGERALEEGVDDLAPTIGPGCRAYPYLNRVEHLLLFSILDHVNRRLGRLTMEFI